MRTVTFSNPEVARAVNDRFIATWVNRIPSFHNCDNDAERGIAKNSFECFATKNFCTFFTTPDRDVIHYASGYYHPKLFLKELEFVREAAEGVLDDQKQFAETATSRYRAIHESHAKGHMEEVARLRAVKRAEGAQISEEDWTSRRDRYIEGMQHLAAVHKDLMERAAMSGHPAQLDQVFDRHLFGNGFEETGKDPAPAPRRRPEPGMGPPTEDAPAR